MKEKRKRVDPATVAFRCSREGIVRSVLRDDLGFQDRLAPGRAFPLAVDVQSVQKALHFLQHLCEQDTAFDWTLNAPVGPNGDLATLYFAGARTDDDFLIIGAGNGGEARRALDELMRINNEQANALRESLKAQEELFRRAREKDAALYHELMRVNNELANLQRELAKKNMELARLNELKSQFLAMAAHDLNHPIGVIMMYGEFLLDEAASALSPEHAEFLRIIVDAGRSMQQILNDFLDITKIEAGRLELHKVPTDVESLVRGAVTLHQWHASKKGIRIDLTVEGPLPRVWVDPPKMEQVMNNLLSNAVKFSPEGSRVQVSLAQNADRIVLCVADRGVGILRDKLDRLFQPFERIRPEGAAREKGSGLGLAIVKKIVEAHEGKVWVESEEGRGSAFFVAIPADLVPRDSNRS